jgi:hypothetical protein
MKKLTIDNLKERREKVESRVMRIRGVLEGHKIEHDKLFSPENRRRLSVQGLQDDEAKLRTRTHASLAKWRTEIIEGIGDSFEHRGQWSKETALRNARFFPEYEGKPGTAEAKMNFLMSELLESTRRNGAEQRASRYSSEDLAAETTIAAERGDIASVAVLAQEAKGRRLQGEERLNFDMALRKLATPEIDEAEALYSDLEALVDESDALLSLWQNPRDEMAAGRESLHRFNRRKRAEALMAEVKAEGEQAKAEEPQQSSAA